MTGLWILLEAREKAALYFLRLLKENRKKIIKTMIKHLVKM